MNYYLVDEYGLVVQVGSCRPETAHLKQRDGLTFKEGVAQLGQCLKGAALVDLPPRPSALHEYNPQTGDWTITNTKLAMIIRNQRNKLLTETDWTQLFDVPEEVRLSYQEYRQSLRDIPLQAGFPVNIVWPLKPE